MKIIKKKIKDCENPDWTRTNVLDLEYTYKRNKGRILVKDYDDKFFNLILKQLRVQVRNNYNLTKSIWVLQQT